MLVPLHFFQQGNSGRSDAYFPFLLTAWEFVIHTPPQPQATNVTINASAFTELLQQSWNQNLEFAHLINYANQLESAQQGHLAAILYRTWLDRNQSPWRHAGYFNLGVTLSNLNDLPGAEAAYQRAIESHATFVQPRLNLGTLYERMGKPGKALQEWRWVADNVSPFEGDNKPMVLMACNHLGRVSETLRQFAEALDWLTKSLRIEPAQPDVIHHWVHLRQRLCIWPTYAPLPGVSVQAMEQATSALAMISITDDPSVQLASAEKFVREKVSAQALPPPARAYHHKRIRIGYLSSDFSNHPVSMLMAELFELHDREKFEVFAYCWSPEDGSALRQRVIRSMEHFHRIESINDAQAAHLIRSHEIDVLVDLQGQTSGARPNILAYRPAPIQLTYLGLPATTGFRFIDYVIADRFLIPEHEAPFYAEKPLYMPDVYQVSDRKREIGPAPSRADYGLPEGKFVFCSFNNNYKFTADVFEAWMRILRRTPNSILWLLEDTPWARENLRREAQARGIAPERIFFSGRVPPANYLARYTLADLFLDTFPFNAGTTANDALWVGLPVLTLTGRAFASRMAGALLTAVGLPELITYNLLDYENKAVELYETEGAISRLKTTLVERRSSSALFDTNRFTRNLEDALVALVASKSP